MTISGNICDTAFAIGCNNSGGDASDGDIDNSWLHENVRIIVSGDSRDASEGNNISWKLFLSVTVGVSDASNGGNGAGDNGASMMSWHDIIIAIEGDNNDVFSNFWTNEACKMTLA